MRAKSAKLGRYVLHALLAALYLGIPVFVVLCIYPVVVNWRDRTGDLAKAQRDLHRWLRSVSLPTETRLESEQAYTDAMWAEHDAVRSYYERRDSVLERSVVSTETGDPMQVKLAYQRLKRDLERTARYAEAREFIHKPFMPEYPWEEPAKTPPREQFPIIQKKAAIAAMLVRRLSEGQSCAIGHLAVFQPRDPEAAADEAQSAEATPAGADAAPGQPPPAGAEADEAGGGPFRYVVWPATVEFVAPFSRIGALLDGLTTAPSSQPCVVLQAVHLEGLRDGQVLANVTLGVLDFE